MSLMSDSIGIDSLNIVTIDVAVSAFIFSTFTFRRNRKSEQIKIASEQMDRGTLSEVRNRKTGYNPVIYFYRIEAVRRECEYFGYMISTGVIKDKNTIRFYKPRVLDLFHYLNDFGIITFHEILNERDLDENPIVSNNRWVD